MLKEINEQPAVVRRILTNYYDKETSRNSRIFNDIKESDRIYMIAAGTSMHASHW
jgi:glutamine---fructose-6-phosphate transaminase (isomerizing)